MFKSKGAVLGIAVTVVASVLLVAGMGITGTSGAGTDLPGNIGSGPGYPLTTGAPPESPIEQPIINPTNPGGSPAATDGTTPGTPATANDNTGGQAGANGGPNALPDTGFGQANGGSSFSTMIILLSMAGAVLAGAGATAVSASRRK